MSTTQLTTPGRAAPGLLGPGVPPHRLWFRRHPLATFLACLIGAFLIMPFEEQFRDGDLIDAVSFTLLLLSALLAVGRRAMALVFGMSLVLPAVAAKWINHSRPDLVSPPSFLIPGGLFVLFVTAHLFWFIFRARKIDSEVLCAGVATWLMLGLIWAFAYTFIAQSNPKAFAFTVDLSSARSLTGSTAIYFSFITLATVGYGDIVPVLGQARMLATMEAAVGTFYMAVLIARLVSLYTVSSTVPPVAPPSIKDFHDGI